MDHKIPQTIVALGYYYAHGPSADWPLRCISPYAKALPWEDWAKTWAHYLQMVDPLETAAGLGHSLRPRHPSAKTISAEPTRAVADGAGFETMLEHWFPLTHAFNSINRGQGLSSPPGCCWVWPYRPAARRINGWVRPPIE